jgi:hypothetical protein
MMAGKTLRLQFAIVAFSEGLIDMVWTQGFKGRPHVKTFKDIRARLVLQCRKTNDLLLTEGTITKRDRENVKQLIETFRQNNIPASGRFDVMDAVSFCIALVVDQLARTKGKKRQAFELLLERWRELDRYFDFYQEYEEAGGLLAAENFQRLTG